MRIETLAVHAGHAPDPSTGAVTTPIYLSSTFEREMDGSYRGGHVYSRSSNPNRSSLELALATLGTGQRRSPTRPARPRRSQCFRPSRPATTSWPPMTPTDGTLRQLHEIFAGWGLEASVVDMANLDAVERAIRPTTKVVWVETPSNPLVRIVDIQRIAELAHSVGARCVVDNTWATPVLQVPLDLGADIVMHSTTKYLGGHSDLLGGALVAKTDDEFFERLRLIQNLGGAVPSPFDCWLLLRGIRTCPGECGLIATTRWPSPYSSNRTTRSRRCTIQVSNRMLVTRSRHGR